jgi:hypothetical protein
MAQVPGVLLKARWTASPQLRQICVSESPPPARLPLLRQPHEGVPLEKAQDSGSGRGKNTGPAEISHSVISPLIRVNDVLGKKFIFVVTE